MKDFRNLEVRERAHALTLCIYTTTVCFPADERFGLTSQMRRCCASIGANIAEGCGRRGNPEFQRFLQIASGSTSEIEYHLLLANDLGYLSESAHGELMQQLTPLRRMLTSLIQKVETEHQMAKS
jgi:four helix bundle protein